MLLSKYRYPQYTPTCENFIFFFEGSIYITCYWKKRAQRYKVRKGNKVHPSFFPKIMRFIVTHDILMDLSCCLCAVETGSTALFFNRPIIHLTPLLRERFTKEKTLWAKGSFSQRREKNDAALVSHGTVVRHICLSVFH